MVALADNDTLALKHALVSPETHTPDCSGISGYRYYNPELGRWVSRDPIEERGGINLYCSILNDPINGFDILGLDADDECIKHFGRYFNTSNSQYSDDFEACGASFGTGTLVSIGAGIGSGITAFVLTMNPGIGLAVGGSVFFAAETVSGALWVNCANRVGREHNARMQSASDLLDRCLCDDDRAIGLLGYTNDGH